MMQTVVNLIRTMKAFGYDVEEQLFKDHEKYKKHHKLKGYRSFGDFTIDDIDLDKLDDLINMLELGEERFGNLSAILDSQVTAGSRSDILKDYFTPGVESDAKNDSVNDKVLFKVNAHVSDTVSEEKSEKSDSEDNESDRKRRSADDEDTFVHDPKSLIAAKLLKIIPQLKDPEGNPIFGDFASRLDTARSISDNNERSGKISKLMKQVRNVL